jgi:hypothetical protein
MTKKLFITNRQREQAERMAAKWEARAQEFYYGGSGWGVGTAGYCKTIEDADHAEQMAERIHKAIARLMAGCGVWADVQVIQAAVEGRDTLDAVVKMCQDG